MPPSLRTRQKWTAISKAAASGMATQCKHVKAQQRLAADEAPAQQQEAGIGAG